MHVCGRSRARLMAATLRPRIYDYSARLAPEVMAYYARSLVMWRRECHHNGPSRWGRVLHSFRNVRFKLYGNAMATPYVCVCFVFAVAAISVGSTDPHACAGCPVNRSLIVVATSDKNRGD